MLDVCLDMALWVTSQVTSSRLSSISEVDWDFNPGFICHQRLTLNLRLSSSLEVPPGAREGVASLWVSGFLRGPCSHTGKLGQLWRRDRRRWGRKSSPRDTSRSETCQFWAEVFKNQRCLYHAFPQLPREGRTLSWKVGALVLLWVRHTFWLC